MSRISDLQLNVGRTIYKRHAQSLFDPIKIHPAEERRGFLASFLYELEAFVLYALDDVVPAVPMLLRGADGAIKSNYNISGPQERYFNSLPTFIYVVQALSSHYDYNECVKVFIYCCTTLDLLEDKPIRLDLSVPAGSHANPSFIAVTGDIFNELVLRIRSEWHRQGLSEKYRSRCREVESRRGKYCNYERALFEHNSRLLVLRVDLLYQRDIVNQISIKDAVIDFNHLIGNKRSNSIFKSMKGFIAKVEYAIDKGLYWHTIFFLDVTDADQSSRVDFGKIIGEYWSTRITKERGAYWNVNHAVKGFEELEFRGSRIINADEIEVRKSVRNAIACLCKTDQCLRPKGSSRIRLIRKGHDPNENQIKKKKNKPARPATMVKSASSLV